MVKTGRPGLFWIAGFVSTSIFFLLFWAGPQFINSPIVLMFLGLALVFGMLRLLDSFDWENPKSALSQLAIVAGALLFLIFLAFLHELNGVRGSRLLA